MSDRGSVIFVNNGEKSVVISSYWGGRGFVDAAISYAVGLKKEVDGLIEQHPNVSGPLERREPDIIAVDFMRHLCATGWVDGRDSGTHLCRSENNVSGEVIEIDLNNPGK